jgi:hypothetical protein
MQWSEAQRETVARQFRQVAGGWHVSEGLVDPQGPLWQECLACHRLRTIAAVDAGEDGGDQQWRCGKCGFESSGREVWEYQTGLLLSISEVPDCPPIVREVLAECGQLLYRISRGQRDAVAEAGNAARHAVRVLDHYGPWDAWFYRVG